jgi:hypothetical protein
MNRRLFLLAALALAGCATAPPKVLAPPGSALEELEPLYAAAADHEALTISVASSGCTAKADFVFYLERRGGSVSLAFARRRLDSCRSFPTGGTELSFTWAELGIAPRTPVFLLNPVVARTRP